MKFDTLTNLFLEYDQPEVNLNAKELKDKPDTSKKDLKLYYHTIDASVSQDPDNKEKYRLSIKSKTDPLFDGYITYPSREDAERGFRNLKDADTIIDYMFKHFKDNDSASKWSRIVADEFKHKQEKEAEEAEKEPKEPSKSPQEVLVSQPAGQIEVMPPQTQG